MDFLRVWGKKEGGGGRGVLLDGVLRFKTASGPTLTPLVELLAPSNPWAYIREDVLERFRIAFTANGRFAFMLS